jgi:hypothetical protein
LDAYFSLKIPYQLGLELKQAKEFVEFVDVQVFVVVRDVLFVLGSFVGEFVVVVQTVV